MTTWIIKNEEEAKRAFKKIFINLFENNIAFEEEYFYNKDKTRTNFFRDIFNTGIYKHLQLSLIK